MNNVNGISCYIISFIHAIRNLPTIKNMIQNLSHSDKFYNLFSVILNYKNVSDEHITLFYNLIINKFNFKKNTQEDATELFISFMSSLEDDYKKITNVSNMIKNKYLDNFYFIPMLRAQGGSKYLFFFMDFGLLNEDGTYNDTIDEYMTFDGIKYKIIFVMMYQNLFMGYSGHYYIYENQQKLLKYDDNVITPIDNFNQIKQSIIRYSRMIILKRN